MSTQIVFETHSLSEDNDNGIASGWRHSRLSIRGRQLAIELGERRRLDGIEAVFSSDLQRAAETARIAFESLATPIFLDWRLRECNYGEGNGMLASELHQDRAQYLDQPYPGGESWRQAVERVCRAIDDILVGWSGQRVLLIGHVATWYALEQHFHARSLEDMLRAPFPWKEGWEYQVDD